MKQNLSGKLRNGTGIFQRKLQPSLAALKLTKGMDYPWTSTPYLHA